MIKIENIKRTYKTGDTEVRALKGINLEISKGEFMSLAGPSGSGKTTLLNLIGCIDQADEGSIKINGKIIDNLDRKQLAFFRRENLGFVFQSFNLIPVLTAFENISLPLSLLNMDEKLIREKVNQILSDVDLDGLGDRYPSKLSGGQQQRVAIARALVKEPIIVLADEPTANLDSKTGESVLRIMEKMNEKYQATFIFSTHDPMVMNFAHRLVLLHDGEITSDKKNGKRVNA